MTLANRGSHQVVYSSPIGRFDNGGNDNDTILKEDWNRLTTAVGTFVRHLGVKAVSVFQSGVAKLKELLRKGKEKVSARGDYEAQADTNKDLVHDEDLFRSLFGDEELFVVPSEPSRNSVELVVSEAAALLAKDELATRLLGPSLSHGRPFSQSRWTTSVNGRSTTTIRASFHVHGSQGVGAASVACVDGRLASLGLQVHGLHYQLETVAAEAQRPEAYKENETHDPIEVEMVDGIRRPAWRRGNIVDAEILDN